MAGTPRYKIYQDAEYMAACKYLEDAAALVAIMGAGATIRDGHARADILWTEGAEKQGAGESYDYVLDVCTQRKEKRATDIAIKRMKSNAEYQAFREEQKLRPATELSKE